MQRETHARNMVMEGDAKVIASGGRKDFLYSSPNVPTYPPARVDRVFHDGDTVSLGGITLTAHKTAGHTRGCTCASTCPASLLAPSAMSSSSAASASGQSFTSSPAQAIP